MYYPKFTYQLWTNCLTNCFLTNCRGASHHVEDLREGDPDVDDDGSRSVDHGSDLAVVVLHQVGLPSTDELSIAITKECQVLQRPRKQ